MGAAAAVAVAAATSSHGVNPLAIAVLLAHFAAFRLAWPFVFWVKETDVLGAFVCAECSSKCSSRCSGTQYKKACLTYCNKCCATCLCVPPGTYGNKGACPCYNNWKTKEGGPKCP